MILIVINITYITIRTTYTNMNDSNTSTNSNNITDGTTRINGNISSTSALITNGYQIELYGNANGCQLELYGNANGCQLELYRNANGCQLVAICFMWCQNNRHASMELMAPLAPLAAVGGSLVSPQFADVLKVRYLLVDILILIPRSSSR